MKPLNLMKTASLTAVALALSAHTVVAQETLRFGVALPWGAENAWSASLISSFENVKAVRPHDLELELAYSENLYGDDALTAMERYAEEGYDIVWGHSSYGDQVEELKDEFPDTMFVMVGSGNLVLGDNAYLLYTHLHEPTYLAGVFAASESKTGTLGVVGLFPADDVNDQVNGFRAGARSVNPDARVVVTFIESWYDPVKASEAAIAQIAAGADIIMQLGESFQPCLEHQVMCIGNFTDASALAPDAVPISVLAFWEPHFNYVIDEWKKHKDSGDPYAAPEKDIWFSMAEGSGDLSPVSVAFSGKVSDETIAAVDAARQAIMSGDLVVELDMSLPVSD